MTTKQPKAEAIVNNNASDVHESLEEQVEPWENTVERLKKGGPTWLATVNPDGTPHLVPVGAGWVGDTTAMLAFTARHGITPMVETFPMAEADRALEHVRASKARFRAVLVA